MSAKTRNERSANAAYRACYSFRLYGEVDDNASPIVSLLVGLMHDRNRTEYGFDFDDALQQARAIYAEQVLEQVGEMAQEETDA